MPEIVQAELESGRSRGRYDHRLLSELVREGFVDLIELDAAGEEAFEQLVIGTAASTLDDGEAAAIACALQLGVPVVIDDQKAIRICREKFPSLTIMSTVDVLRAEQTLNVLGGSRLEKAVLNALQVGRMRVLDRDLDWVVEQIGIKQAMDCPSLPRSKLAIKAKGRTED